MINEFSGKYRYLSNFWLCPVILDHVVYPSVENAYQAAKVEANDQRTAFITCSPSEAKRKGKKIESQDTLRNSWHEMKVDIMHQLLVQKFADGSFLAEKLRDTGDTKIVEGNTWEDTFWGCL